MSTLTSLGRAIAFGRGRAASIATRRCMHVHSRPLIFVPLTLAGEANAPLACLVGATPDDPRLLIVPQPRNRDLRFAFAASLADVVLPYVDSFATDLGSVDDDHVFADAPQLVVANPSGVAFTALLGRSTRLRRTDGDYAVAASVPLLGRWLTYFAERAEHPGSSSMVDMTTALSQHWATGQSSLEDGHLASLMAWIEPPDGMSGREAARRAEDPLLWPPAGPQTDPSFDNEVLAPLIRSYDHALDDVSRVEAARALESKLREQMISTWRLIWRGLDLLRELPAGASVERHWLSDRKDFTGKMRYWMSGGLPQARRDQAVAAARRLNYLEREQDNTIVDRAIDDPLLLAEFRLAGEAFAGSVVACDPTRVDATGPRRKLRPYVVLATSDPVNLGDGVVVRSPARPNQAARIIETNRDGEAGTSVVLELTGGMGRSLTPSPGTVPELGERIAYATLAREEGRPPVFPAVEDTPWTHGGSPVRQEPTHEDAVEAWS